MKSMRKHARIWILAVPLFTAVLVFGCGGGGSEDDMAVDRDTLTRAQKDSILSESPLPGARGVGTALEAAEAARERAEAHDTIH